MRTIRIGTRRSRLACIQAELVADYIRRGCEGYDAELVPIVTAGDRIQSKKLDEIGQKGLFVKELDIALMDGTTDLSVHCLKDMPMELPDGLPLLGFSVREDPRDVLVLPAGCGTYDGGPIGSSSNRRILQLKGLYPHSEVKTVRGNVLTRLEKLDRGEYGALVLAAAGLKRLGLAERISRYFSVEEIVPAAGQGTLCVQGRAGEDYSFLEGFYDQAAGDCARCERAYMTYLNGGCSTPAGVYAEVLDGTRMTARGLYYDEASGTARTLCIHGERSRPEELGMELAKKLKEQ